MVLASFWITLKGLDYYDVVVSTSVRQDTQPPGAPIATFGDSATSEKSFRDTTRFQFKGQGYTTIEGTKDLRCLTSRCNFSLTVEFGDLNPGNTQLLIGQSFSGEPGWHLLFVGAQLILQTDGGAIQISAPFKPELRRRYKIDITSSEEEVTISVDNNTAAKSKLRPFTDVNRDISVGGRPGASPLGLNGEITNLRITKRNA